VIPKNVEDVDTSAAEEAVQAFEEAEEEFKALLQDIKDSLGEDWYEYLLETMDKRRTLCTRARQAVRGVKTGVGNFGVRAVTKNAWDPAAAVELARVRDERDELIDAGVLKYSFDHKRASEVLEPHVMAIYKEKAHSTYPGTTQVLGPKPDDDLFK